MNKHEQQYCVTREELLAVVVVLKIFHSYLYGQDVLLRTYNAAITWMKNLKKPTGQTARWLQEIETYNLTVIHRARKKHYNVDALSRRSCSSCKRQKNKELLEVTVTRSRAVIRHGYAMLLAVKLINTFLLLTMASSLMAGHLILFVRPNYSTKNFFLLFITKEADEPRPAWNQVSYGLATMKTIWRLWNRLVVYRGILCRQFLNDDGELGLLPIIVPSPLRTQVLKYLHDIPTGAHLGPEKTLDRIRKSLYWPKMKRYIEKCLNSVRPLCSQKTVK